VVQTAWLGDVLLTTPLLEALVARHGPVDVLVTPEAATLVETHPAVGRVFAYDKRGRDRGLGDLWRQARTLRERRYEVAILAQGSFRSGLLTWLAGIPRRVGFADQPAARWCTDRLPRPDGHQAERLRALAQAAPSGRPGTAALSLVLTAGDHTLAETALRRAGIAGPFVVLAPGSARSTKRWPYYRGLATLLAAEAPVVVLGLDEDGWGPDPTGRGVADLTALPLRASAAVLQRAAAAVVNDSAPLHLAQAVGTPVVAIFGPTHPSLGFGPRGPRDLALGLPLACRPCSTHGGQRCPLGHHRCLRELSADTVLEALRRVLAAEEAPCVS